MRKISPFEELGSSEGLAQVHVASEWRSQNSDPAWSDPKAVRMGPNTHALK